MLEAVSVRRELNMWILRSAAMVVGASLVACAAQPATGSTDEDLEIGAVAESSGPGGGGGGLRPLSSEPVPQPVGGHIVDQAAAIRLGKALFWDTQAGGDGQQACASCHFAGGADDRRRNTLLPGGDKAIASGGATGPGQLFVLSNITNDDVVGSSGVVAASFDGVDPDPTHPADLCTVITGGLFDGNRQVTGRNAPSVIGAVFFRDAFWDGRANHTFNGNDPFGQTRNAGGSPLGAIGNGALASQAVGPANNPVEMSCNGRTFNGHGVDGHGSLGTKLLARQPLQLQRVAIDDSVLGALANPDGPGLVCGDAPCSYGAMIREAFGAALADGAEDSFSLLWGEAIQAYEATLVPDQTPLDRYLAGDRSALTSQQQAGMNTFQGKGNCTKCHAGAALSDATIGFFAANGAINRDGGDQGFHNLGVRPTSEDLGRGATPDPQTVPSGNAVAFSASGAPADRGAFKTPALRNVKLTAPYFHNGGKATLADVVAFYSRGGDFANAERARDLQPRSFSAAEQAQLVDFLANGLTDCRVEQQRAPFDHPALPIPNREPLAETGAGGTGSCP
jgi:cytochrome c peroxidase